MLRFHALVTHLYDELGHRYVYHQCLRSAILDIGFSYQGYANKKCRIKDMPVEWERCLAWKDEKKAWGKMLQLFKRAWCFSRIFRRKPQVNEQRIFFLESLWLTDLAALAFSLTLFSKRNDYFWLLLRYDLKPNSRKETLYRFFFRLLRKKMGKRLIFLSDSKRVGTYFEALLGQQVHIVPIPHTRIRQAAKPSTEKYVLWWPGRPDWEKGSGKIQALARLPATGLVEVCLSRQASKWIQNPSSDFRFLNPVLSREEYLSQFDRSDAILLPYNPVEYYARTSGIFVEAVFAGKLPLVAEGSWLANELHTHNLEELILDWASPDIFSRILELFKDASVQKKFKAMQKAYFSYHSLPSFTNELKRILKCSQIGCT